MEGELKPEDVIKVTKEQLKVIDSAEILNLNGNVYLRKEKCLQIMQKWTDKINEENIKPLQQENELLKQHLLKITEWFDTGCIVNDEAHTMIIDAQKTLEPHKWPKKEETKEVSKEAEEIIERIFGRTMYRKQILQAMEEYVSPFKKEIEQLNHNIQMIADDRWAISEELIHVKRNCIQLKTHVESVEKAILDLKKIINDQNNELS